MALEKRMKNIVEFKMKRAKLAAEKYGVDGFLVSLPENIYSFTGVTSINSMTQSTNETYLVINPSTAKKGIVFGCVESPMVIEDAHADLYPYGPFRFYVEEGESCPFVGTVRDVTERAAPTLYDGLKKAITQVAAGCKRIAVDDSCMPNATYRMLEEQFPQVEFVANVEITQYIMSVKHPEEIVDLKRAVNIAEEALQKVLEVIHLNMTEHQIKVILATEMARRDANPYFITVTANERGSYAEQFAKKDSYLKRGSVLRLDWGCIYKNMRSDIGRTIVVGENPAAERHYESLVAGKRAIVDAIRPGAVIKDLFHLGMDVIQSAGIPHYKRHHLGHSTGLEMYANPIIAPGSDYILEENMTFCVETPFYQLGHWGLQVEDCVQVGSEGAIRLNNLSDDLIRVLI